MSDFFEFRKSTLAIGLELRTWRHSRSGLYCFTSFSRASGSFRTRARNELTFHEIIVVSLVSTLSEDFVFSAVVVAHACTRLDRNDCLIRDDETARKGLSVKAEEFNPRQPNTFIFSKIDQQEAPSAFRGQPSSERYSKIGKLAGDL